MELNDYYIINACDGLTKSVKAVLSHHQKYTNKCNGFIRAYPFDTENQERPSKGNMIFPTATFHGASALLCAMSYNDLFSPDLMRFVNECEIFSGEEIDYDSLERIIHDEIKHISTKNNISRYVKESNNNGVRSIILFEQILSVIYGLKQSDETFKWDVKYNEICEFIFGPIDNENEKKDREKYYYPPAGQSPWFLLSLMNCRKYIKEIFSGADILNSNFTDVESLIDGHLNYHMARYNVKELSFDPVSLIIALCCKISIRPEFKYTPFFISCLKAAVEQQYVDGSWPTGATISFNKAGDVIQQATIQIASYLADAIVDYKFLVDCDDSVESILEIIIPSFRKLSQLMESTFEKNDDRLGWSSDRLKVKRYTETWITAYSCRFYHKYWLIEKSYSRIKALKYFGVTNYDYSVAKNNIAKVLWEEVLEPDYILTPKATINKIIQPISKSKERGMLHISPRKNQLSLIICGPPGSGKTYAIERMADAIGWPLVELSPSQFIKNGLDFIESTNKEIFNNLSHLCHAVVFFDECDELFRSRKNSDSSSRTILSFLTASMLPKLQKLHDKGNIVFVLGTNFLHNMDDAVTREGRFDFKILWDRPDAIARARFYDDKKRSPDFSGIEFRNKEDYIDKTQTLLVRNLGKYLSQSSDNPKFDYDYVEWCLGDATEGKVDFDSLNNDGATSIGMKELKVVLTAGSIEKMNQWLSLPRKK